jgi:hypothetical protein
MSKKSKNQEILESIKKNDPRFKDMIIEPQSIIMPSIEEFFGNDISMDEKTKDVIYVNESNNNTE